MYIWSEFCQYQYEPNSGNSGQVPNYWKMIDFLYTNFIFKCSLVLFLENNVHTANNFNFNIWGGYVKLAENVAGPTSKIGPNWSNVPHGTGSEKLVGPIPKIGPNWSYVLHGTGSNLWHWTWSNVAHGTGILLASSRPGMHSCFAANKVRKYLFRPW